MFSRRTDWKLAPNRFTLAHQEALGSGKRIYDLTLSNPTHAGIEYDEPAILDALRNPRSLDYDPQSQGLASAREAVADYYGTTAEGKSTAAKDIFLTTSTSEAYSYVFPLLANPGDEVLVLKPSYPLFDFLADLQDVRLVPYPLLYDHGWHIDLHSLEHAITPRTRAIILVNPNNPTGSFVSAAERSRLNELCNEHDLALVVDEVFLDYALDGTPHQSFATNRDALTLTMSGLSKISALPQMKLAWIVVSGPDSLARVAMERLDVIADTYLSVNAPVQLAARVLLDQRKKIQPQLLTRVRGNLSELDAQLSRQKSCSRLEVEGGWYAVLRVPATRSDEDLAIEILRECSVLVHPGHFFDFPRDGFLVLSLITPAAEFSEGASRLLELCRQI